MKSRQQVAHACDINSPIESHTPRCTQFSTLPGELRHEIYRQYLGKWDAIIEYDRKSAQFMLQGQPDYDLLLTCQSVYQECSCLVPLAFSGTLILRDAKVRREKGFGYVSSFDAVASTCPPWLLKKTKTLSIIQGTTGMLMSLPWHLLPAVQTILLEGNSLPIGYYYPCGIAAAARESQLKHILQGRYDTWCLNGYSTWSQTPSAVEDGRVRVLTIRRGTVKGSSLEIWVEHKSECAEVVFRSIEGVPQNLDSHDDVTKLHQKVEMAPPVLVS